jgi:hypothetical protein
MGVLAYQEGSLRDFTVTAAPSSVADVEDEAAVGAVDSASLALEPQQFVEVGGDPMVPHTAGKPRVA